MSDLEISISGVRLTIHDVTGAKLTDLFGVDSTDSKYRNTGDWYHTLTEFPATLWDANGYIRFESKEHFERSPYFKAVEEPNSLHVVGVNDISEIPGYVRIAD